ncbi:hypothetical protein [Mycolicibacterium goodii]|uniref:hypothetical protein n=1 Tax=Mycolicibacterium goodii TaxID=134601 RepID=UPI001BDDAA1D|nr:hypothetical protein [Mycolicibacterium goodii]MBU8834572.1 hypothetical protein [Mycolicibacterium goodii]
MNDAQAEAGQAAREASPAEARSEVRVYVMEVEMPAEGVGYTSVHRTIDGARRKLEAIVDQWGMRAEYDAITANAVNDAACFAAGEEGDPIVWGISLLPVED